MSKKLFFLNLTLILILLFSNVVLSSKEDNVLVNSKDWRDVYSASLYASLEGEQSNFITSSKYSKIILGTIEKSSKIFAVSSKKKPYVKGYKASIMASGYENVEEIVTDDSNLELGKRLDKITNFIIIDDAYGYNAISVTSYAVISKSYVLFANKNNIDEVINLLNNRNVNELIIFGNVDREVKKGLASYNPEIINEGDRFNNNLKMVDKYLALNPDSKQVFLTNGEFIESSLMSGQDPVIFIGKVNVPTQVRDYIKKSPFQVATLIGNELIGVAQFIKDQIGIPVFVKFAQGARSPSGGISQVEDLDRFPMPKYNLLLGIYEIKYNQATKKLEVTYENKVDLGTYFMSTITVNTPNGDVVVGDDKQVFIDKGNYKTIAYNITIEGDTTDLSAHVYTLFGESTRSMENILEADYNVSTIQILDNSNIQINSLVYDKRNSEFIIEIENIGDVDTFVSPEIIDLYVNDETLNFGINSPIKIEKGKIKKIRIQVDELGESDILENDIIRTKAYYGERKTTLFKLAFAEFGFQYKKSNYYIYIIIIVLIILLLLAEFSKKKCPNCKHKNKRSAKRCVKCHHKL